ncbi:hypothetical protein PENTCL1PPCAC_28271 [Pristionchus entomophagus]|uniref:Uncharacterized protein n=1 Tax=Pristionchus entomophagus TaxID=358040 RepID=A0AAV5UGN7_9BILA|nr:hypothetical protein PENTCL1PPCAC_28271 [Pristionchus entomophagus]
MIASSLVALCLLAVSSAANQQLNRSKRQFLEVEGDYLPQYSQPLNRYGSRWSAAADPYYSGVSLSSPTLLAAAPRPVYYQPAPVVVHRRPLYREYVPQYVPVRSLYRAKQIVLERPVTTVIERPARVLTPIHPSPSALYIEMMKKKKRMMARQ